MATVLAGTGHRPEKLGGYGWDVYSKLFQFAKGILVKLAEYEQEIEIISGMALGWDMALADAALALNIPFIAAIPFDGQELKWSPLFQTHYHRLLKSAVLTKVVCEGPYAVWKLQERNEWMMDNCTRALALWNGSKGGTANCVAYAKLVGVPVENVWSQWENWARAHNIPLTTTEN